MLLGLSGRIGAGKSTLARFLQTNSPRLWPGRRFQLLSFAYPLKELCIGLFGVHRPWAYGTQEDKARFVPHLGMTVRDCFERVGKACTSVYPMVFTHRAIAETQGHQNRIVVFDDVRFPEEADAIHAEGGRVLRLERGEQRGSAPETAMDGFDGFDGVIPDMGLEDSQMLLLAHLANWGWIKV